MKQFSIIILFLFVNSIVFSQSQHELNQTAKTEYEKSDSILNTVYQNISEKYEGDKVFIINLKDAQRKWIEFRDAELNMKYPEREKGFYGTVLPMCKSYFLQELTNTRILTLKKWLAKPEEGDVCIGSMR